MDGQCQTAKCFCTSDIYPNGNLSIWASKLKINLSRSKFHIKDERASFIYSKCLTAERRSRE